MLSKRYESNLHEFMKLNGKRREETQHHEGTEEMIKNQTKEAEQSKACLGVSHYGARTEETH